MRMYNLNSKLKPSELWLIAKNNAASNGYFDNYALDTIAAICKSMNYFNFANDLFAACVDALSKNEEDIINYSQAWGSYDLLNKCIANNHLNIVFDIVYKKLLQHEVKDYSYDNIANFDILEAYVVAYINKYFCVNDIIKREVFEYYNYITDRYGQNISLIKEKFRGYIDAGSYYNTRR